MRSIIILALLVSSTVCWAGDGPTTGSRCAGIERRLPDKEFSATIIRVLSQDMPKKEDLEESVVIDKLDKYMGKKNWHIVWATPKNMETGVFILFGDRKKLDYVAVWGGTAFPEEEPSVLEWLKSQAPAAPVSLLECVAHWLTHGEENGDTK